MSLGSEQTQCVRACKCVHVCVCTHMPPLSRNKRVLPEVITSIKSLRPGPSCLSHCLSVHQLASLRDFLLLVSLIISSGCSRSTSQWQQIKLQEDILPLTLCAEEAKKKPSSTSTRQRLLLLGGIHQPPLTSPPPPSPAYTPSNGPNDSDRGLSHADL